MEKVERDTGQTPPALQKRPKPNRWNEIYWKAYQDLSSSRAWTQGGPTEIPYLAKLAWLDENQLFDEDDRADILYAIQRLDITYVEFIAKKLEKK